MEKFSKRGASQFVLLMNHDEYTETILRKPEGKTSLGRHRYR